LEIGAITPEEIAVSIVGEMIAVRRQAGTGVKRKRSERRMVTG
jgi:xanthine/CO dehydrogenase XdhC/CoxF family maturation factor